MNVGMIGLGKLGLPCALAMESKGHSVIGYDPNPDIAEFIAKKEIPYQEAGVQQLLQHTKIKNVSISEVVDHAEIIFLAVQTPHLPEYEGITRIPEDRKDFDYSILKKACADLSAEIDRKKKSTIVVIISTVLPGTIEREIKPLLSPFVKLCYNPYFIAMSTTIENFLYPEFVLFGVDDKEALVKAKEFYRTINGEADFVETNIKEAELTKVLYNTYIGMKIVFANTLMEISQKMGGIDCDVVTEALAKGYKRILSRQYLYGGMGDGGSCHPRDNIALSWLAKQFNLSYDWFTSLMMAREKQTEWLAKLIVHEHEKSALPIAILGKAYKPQTALPNGSPSILLHNILHEFHQDVEFYDPFMDGEIPQHFLETPHLFFIGTKHKEFQDYIFPKGSVVIDPFRYIPHSLNNEYKLISIGRKL